MVAANICEVSIIKYLIDQGADSHAHDLGKKNDGQFGSSIRAADADRSNRLIVRRHLHPDTTPSS